MAALMLQGTGSDVGKSVLVAGLCRAFANRGLIVRPFKPQNMSNNAAVTADGGEIGRAQATQALACRVPPSVHMNPVLLKPQGDRTSQLVLRGQVRGTLRAARWREGREGLLPEVLESYRLLSTEADLVLVEGAGSPAEINLRAGDIANMGFARAADVPVLLVGDIDRGGVIASLVGTHAILDPADAAMIQGFLVNKFRGDPALFADGMQAIAMRTGWAPLGIVSWLAAARRLPSEDAVVLERPRAASEGRVRVACPITSRIANFDDLDPLKLEPAVDVRMVPPGQPIPDVDWIVLAGSKATLADLDFLRGEGWDIDIKAHHRRGRPILGLCGGYQMLGRRLSDPLGLEGPPRSVEGLGLLDVETRLTGTKKLSEVQGEAQGAPFNGYEIHLGETEGPDRARPAGRLADGRTEGATSADGLVVGSYVHGLLGRPEQRAVWLARLGAQASGPDHRADIEAALDEIAAQLEAELDLDAMLRIAQNRR
ncbi:cobyric acid synthase [Sandaracinobacter sp. RS1-74]|uniref:cobyric acid synthase n=1 Tax=Sandaracinobacteroides sayramensis TaxID=2913411 RepID=UPI001EDA07E8|nr:cobyric acid synthase [Sandaracinobacteroides sayramensis]MCG2841617.1 cobyric acid synthase [Sandaracinobacteroides sayramensis]